MSFEAQVSKWKVHNLYNGTAKLGDNTGIVEDLLGNLNPVTGDVELSLLLTRKITEREENDEVIRVVKAFIVKASIDSPVFNEPVNFTGDINGIIYPVRHSYQSQPFISGIEVQFREVERVPR